MSKLKWFGGKDNVDQLVARGKLKRAIQLLEAQLKDDPDSLGCRQQLGDLLGRAGDIERAIVVLGPLIDAYARDGFSTKAIAVIKKLERLDPSRVDSPVLIARVLNQGQNVEAPPLIPAHLESDTGDFEPMPVASDRPIATSSIDVNWMDQMDAKRAGFRWSPLLDDLPAEAFNAVVGDLTLLVKNPGAIIVGQGEPASSIFILASGFARAYRRSRNHRYRQAMVFEEGQFFGEEALFVNPAERRITVTAASECELLEIDLDSLQKIVAASPAAHDNLEKAHRRRPWGR